MAYIDWLLKGPKIASCSCDYGCPCEFNAPPTTVPCQGLEAHRIDEGWFGDVRLDGLVYGGRFRWPGPVHEGGGLVQGFIDERASEAQVDALFRILGGEEQEPTTPFNIYGSTIERELDPIIAPVEFSCDMEQRTGGFTVAGYMDLSMEPIRNPVTGAAHFAQIVLHNGFEFRTAEMASGDFRAEGDEFGMDGRGRYAFLTYVAYGPHGLVE